MLKNFARSFSNGFSKFFTIERVVLITVFLVLAFGLYSYSGSKSIRLDSMATGETMSKPTSVPVVDSSSTSPTTPGPTSDVSTSKLLSGHTAQSVTSPQELLPKDQNSQWATLNPVSQGNIVTPDLLQAGYHIGLDTIGQTLRNANLQVRSDPVIEKSNIGPWNQSTMEPDLGRVPLEVGYTQR